MTDHPFERLLSTHDADEGCDAGFDVADAYVEAVLRGEDVARAYPGVLAHLRLCPACREDVEGMLAAARQPAPPPREG